MSTRNSVQATLAITEDAEARIRRQTNRASRSFPAPKPRHAAVTCLVGALVLVISGCATNGVHRQAMPAQIDNGLYEPRRTPTPNANNARPDALFKNASDAYRRGDLQAAEQQFKALIKMEPNHGRARYNLAMINLHHAYTGLTHYLGIEPDGKGRETARTLLEQLEQFSATR